jgi:parallel beta-helix repeat protein
MRDKSIKLITTFLVLLFLISIFSISPTTTSKNEIFQTNIKEDTLKSSTFWNLTGSPISIDDSNPSNNWSYTASHYDWCSGSGSWIDPYIIENVTIDGQGSGSCIEIKNSDVYFIIRNCSLHNSSSFTGKAGFKLYNVDNGKIINNNCSNNIYHGILFDECNNNTLSGNTASNNFRGIYLSGSDKNTLSGNTVCNNNLGIYLNYSDNNTLSGNTACNNGLGIELWYSDNNPLSGNIASNNNNDGIYISGGDNNPLSGNTANNNRINGIYLRYSDDSSLSGNTASNNSVGIFLYYSNNNPLSGNTASNNINNGIYLSGSDKNTLSGNTASNNNNYGINLYSSSNNTFSENTATNNRYGINLYSSSNNTFSENRIRDNKNYGIYIYGGTENTYNLIFNNSFLNNSVHAYDDGIDNYWNNSVIGNYWDDYKGEDSNDDGIGDTPYNISGSANSQDNYPIWWDFIDISIDTPNPNEVFGTIAPNFTISIDGGLARTTWYTIDNGSINIIFTGLTGTINQSLWDALPEGNVVIKFCANDTLGMIGFAEVTVIKKITQPSTFGIPGYDLLFLLGIISTVVVIIIKKRLNHLN